MVSLCVFFIATMEGSKSRKDVLVWDPSQKLERSSFLGMACGGFDPSLFGQLTSDCLCVHFGSRSTFDIHFLKENKQISSFRTYNQTLNCPPVCAVCLYNSITQAICSHCLGLKVILCSQEFCKINSGHLSFESMQLVKIVVVFYADLWF